MLAIRSLKKDQRSSSGPPVPLDRYQVKIDTTSKIADPIRLSENELAQIFLSATGQHVTSSSRFIDGALSI